MGGFSTSAVQDVVLVALVLAAAVIDVREHRIPNVLVAFGLVTALLIAHLPGSSVGNWIGGLSVGLAMTLPLYFLRAMGAGDVKMMGMVGSFLGPSEMFSAGLVVFVVGGVLGLVTVIARGTTKQLLSNLKCMLVGTFFNAASPGVAVTVPPPAESVGVQPYGVSIAGGTLLYLTFFKGGIFQ